MDLNQNKPRVLFNFGYHRKGWIAPIEKLRADVEIIYLFFLEQSLETARHTSERVVYWNDFSSAQHLLDTVRPDKIVFMSIDSGLSILLNYSARKRKIPTYLLQHGTYSNYADYRARERKARHVGRVASERPATKFRTSKFYQASVSLMDVPALMLFPLHNYLLKRESRRFADRWVRFKARMPDFYICYSEQNALIHRETDKPPRSKFRYIGNPELDEYFQFTEHNRPTHNYFLLIDQPFADNKYGEHICTRTQMIAHYHSLSSYCNAREARLIVKLHPESYDSEWLPDNDNITWIRDTNELPGLILGARGCFGYFSTLLMPAIYFNRCILFKVSDNEMQVDAEKLGLIQLIDFFTYTISEFDWEIVSKAQLDVFVQKYLLLADGKSVDRLREIIRH
jgi:hypothetical protein